MSELLSNAGFVIAGAIAGVFLSAALLILYLEHKTRQHKRIHKAMLRRLPGYQHGLQFAQEDAFRIGSGREPLGLPDFATQEETLGYTEGLAQIQRGSK